MVWCRHEFNSHVNNYANVRKIAFKKKKNNNNNKLHGVPTYLHVNVICSAWKKYECLHSHSNCLLKVNLLKQ